MARLIDADALMDVIRQHEYRLATKQGAIDYGMFTLGIQQAVDEQPTVDAVPVIRCKDCIHSYDDLCGLCCTCGPYVDCVVQPEFYCADGKRKDSDGND